MNIHDEHFRTTAARERTEDLRRSYGPGQERGDNRTRRLVALAPAAAAAFHRLVDGRRRRATTAS